MPDRPAVVDVYCGVVSREDSPWPFDEPLIVEVEVERGSSGAITNAGAEELRGLQVAVLLSGDESGEGTFIPIGGLPRRSHCLVLVLDQVQRSASVPTATLQTEFDTVGFGSRIAV